ncbi:6-hydroxytryprostatin B O-methyltransferase [Achaetomium macrosporum]|uniref:6-hydroxytryprostatin B O-methyltransferase n=1 Tax=Achaetomium macrosporum TaxID=79813 RepID=A0AAN7H6T1_9PEZI|nr:6-hydroxytryprostatin B O-methyltransferase [Achaetomium macrosporum]
MSPQLNGSPAKAANAPSSVSRLPQDAPVDVRKARQSLMDTALQLFQLAACPSEFVPNLAPGYQYVACLTWLLRFDIFHLVPAPGTVSYRDLAAAASKLANTGAAIPKGRLKSIVRMAMTAGLFREPKPDRVGHSATSALLARDADVHAWAFSLCTSSAPTALSMTAAHDRFTPASVAKSETAFNVAFGTELPFFDWLAQNPAKRERFAGYMRNVTTSEGVHVKHLVNGHPWADLGSGALVVDAYPTLRFVVQDLPDNANAGRQAAEATFPDHISSRLTFQGHDFTQPQPMAGADVYLLRMILHDWPDHVAVTIVKNLLLVMDTVLPAPGQVPSSVERIVRVRDLTMMQAFNSHERDLEQWTTLLAAADGRLRLRRVIEPFGSAMALLEVELDG